MNWKIFYLSIFVIFCFSGFQTIAQEQDTLYLRNGQIMVGKLNSIALGIIEFDDLDLSVQNVRYHKIKTIKASKSTYRIETIDQKVYFGILKPTTTYGEVIVDDGFVEKPYPIVDIYNLVSLEKRFVKKIKGTVSAGYSYTKSSDIGRTNFDWNLRFTEDKYQVNFTGSFIFTNNQGEKTRDRESVALGTYYNITSVLVGGLAINYQRNIELGLASRLQQVLGFGRRFLYKSNLQGILISGLVMNQERSLEGTATGNLFEIPLQYKLSYFHYAAPNLSFTFFPKAFLGLNQNGRKRFDGDANIDWEVINNLNLGIQFYSSFDSQALEGSTTNFDYGIVLNIGYKFK
jgi:hypothetical protein